MTSVGQIAMTLQSTANSPVAPRRSSSSASSEQASGTQITTFHAIMKCDVDVPSKLAASGAAAQANDGNPSEGDSSEGTSMQQPIRGYQRQQVQLTCRPGLRYHVNSPLPSWRGPRVHSHLCRLRSKTLCSSTASFGDAWITGPAMWAFFWDDQGHDSDATFCVSRSPGSCPSSDTSRSTFEIALPQTPRGASWRITSAHPHGTRLLLHSHRRVQDCPGRQDEPREIAVDVETEMKE